jgi:2-polyprenyl-3-methyl-5-hydroxy-6-metoxy-1,4-benzoquinol methylase
MRLAAATDFYNGPIYTFYRWHEGFAKRAQLFADRPDPILVVGCAFGFLVAELEKMGKTAYGIDASWWAVKRRVSQNVICASIFDPPFRSGEFATVATEDVLPYFSDCEAQVAAKSSGELAPNVIHLVTEHGQAKELNYHSCVEWTRITQQLTISLEGM